MKRVLDEALGGFISNKTKNLLLIKVFIERQCGFTFILFRKNKVVCQKSVSLFSGVVLLILIVVVTV